MINAFSTLFLVLLLISSLFKIILALRHISFIQLKRANVPDAFKENISLESHQKAADYTVSKVKLSFVALFVDIALILFLTFGGGIKAIDSFALSFTTDPINQGVMFLALLFLPALFSFLLLLFFCSILFYLAIPQIVTPSQLLLSV